MKFKYSKFPAQPSEAFPEIKEVWRPVIPIKIINKSKEYGYLALVDSGADFCEFFQVMFDFKKKIVDLRPKYL